MIKIRRGLDLPIAGAPRQEIGESTLCRSVALLGRDYPGMKPTMAVREGDRVKLGQPLFGDKKTAGVVYTSPACGTVTAINRGARRKLLSVVVDVDGDEEVGFEKYSDAELQTLTREKLVENLVRSGLWTALRTRPFSQVPAPDCKPDAIFVNAMDTNPLAADPGPVIEQSSADFIRGINVLAALTHGSLYVCKSPQAIPAVAGAGFRDNVKTQIFSGPHPAGLTGTHIHFLDPVGSKRQVWSINYQDVIAVGCLFVTGRLMTSRVISLAGPQIASPRLVRTRLGANLHELVAGEMNPGENRVISGSVLAGRTARSAEDYLGRYHLQVTVLKEGRERPLLGYLSPGTHRHSVMGIYISGLFKNRRFALTTNTQGSNRAMVPVGSYEKVMPLDILPTQLLRALIVGDVETSINLGALELDEEDLALCSYVCPGKYEYGRILRDNLDQIQKEG
ncbi:MAG: Na(+)-translocating NADH-quinone reductase subunit A [Pseudohongiellaceae bacterium]